LRARKFAEAKAKGYRLASYVSPRADVGPWFQAGENCLILDGVGIQPGARIGHNVSIWNNTLIGHHSVIADDVWIAAGATIGGMVEVGRASFIGLNATLGGEAKLGAESFVGAAALVLKSGPDKSVFVQAATERFRLDSSQFLRMTRMPTIGNRD
jgi:acetyltransferase-like isoleucine patch superfamily enzyme